MPEGVVVGGWGFVIAAYSVTAVGLGIYIVTLLARKRGLDKRGNDE